MVDTTLIKKKKNKKICMLAGHHNPFDARITYKEAVSLQRAGYKVTLVAPYKENKTFIFKNIKIIGFKKAKRPFRKISILVKLIRIGLGVNADIYHCHEVDASLFAGIWIKKALQKKGKNVKLIYDAHEYWPALWAEITSNPILKKIIHFIVNLWEKWALKYCDAVFTANEVVKRHLLSLRKNIDIEVLYNCPILELFQDKKNSNKSSVANVICHEGDLTFARGLKNMVRVLKKLKKEVDKNIKLLIVGNIPLEKERRWLEGKIIKYNLRKNIINVGVVPYDKVGNEIQKCNIGIILFQPIPNNILAGPPNKLFNYMRYGLPVIAPKYCLETKRIVEETKCGLLTDATKISDIYNAIKYLLLHPDEAKEMGENGRKAVLEKYNWEKESKKLLKIYNNL